jgi:hypothetical protein
LAPRIAMAMNGAASLEKPAGSPRLRSHILVPPSGVSCELYAVSIGNGPSEVLITNRSPGRSCVTS